MEERALNGWDYCFYSHQNLSFGESAQHGPNCLIAIFSNFIDIQDIVYSFSSDKV